MKKANSESDVGIYDLRAGQKHTGTPSRLVGQSM